MDVSTKSPRRKGHVLLGGLLAAIVAATVLLAGTSDRAQARRRYSYPGYPERIAQCKARCTGGRGAIMACIARDRKSAVASCRGDLQGALASCAGDATCKRDARSNYRLCAKTKAQNASYHRKQVPLGKCNGCCQRSRGGGNCIGYFSGSRFYGSRRYHGRLNCEDSGDDSGGSGGGSCEAVCELVYRKQTAACEKSVKARGGSSECLVAAEASFAQCKQACQPSSPTTTTTSTTAPCGPGCQASPSGAFLPGVADAIRSHLARLVPSLVDGWSD